MENPRGCWVESQTISVQNNFEVAYATLRRKGAENEDITLASKDGSGVFVVDGMGGCRAGALFASAAAHVGVSALGRGLSASRAIEEASKAAASVEEHVLGEHGGAAGLGLRFLEDGIIEYSSRGDVVAWAVSNGRVTELLKPHCKGFRLTDYLGNSKGVQDKFASGYLQLDNDSTLIVMTDGAWRYVSPKELTSVVEQNDSLESSILEIMNQALLRMTPDDASVLACRLNPSMNNEV